MPSSFASVPAPAIRRLLAALFAFVLASLAAAPTASGHASFLEATPAAGARVEQSPGRVALAFTEPVNARLTRVSLVDSDTGETVPTRRGRAAGRHLSLRPAGPLERGAYRVRWRTVSTVDGHVREGYFSFGVGAEAGAAQGRVGESPLARSGWVRVAARLGLYLSLLVFAGGLLLRAILARRRRGPWLGVDPATAGEAAPAEPRALARELSALRRAGSIAVAFGVVVALAEGANAVGGLSPAVATDFLLANGTGLARVAVPALVLGALVLQRIGRDAPAALLATSALGAIASSGHAAGASPPTLAVVSAWVHLVAVATWLGGIVLLAVAWGPALREIGPGGRRVIVKEVLPRFGRVALPAFLVLVATGVVNSIMELGTLDALWTTAYGRVLLAKIAIVVLMAGVSLVHAGVLRPKLTPSGRAADEVAERRHWRLVRGEPLLGVGAVIAVALLVGFPTPPRELAAAAGDDKTRDCAPCPVPVPRPGELSVAGWTGQEIVAGWIRRSDEGLEGEVRVYERTKAGAAPAARRLRVAGAEQRPCGRGCAQFELAARPRSLRLRVTGRPEVVLPARWRAGADERARRLVRGAFERLRRADSVRLEERVTGEGGMAGRVSYVMQAPDRMAYHTKTGTEFVFADRYQWVRPTDMRTWQRISRAIPYRTENWLRSPIFVQGERLLAVEGDGDRRTAIVAYMDSGTPGWGVARIDLDTRRVERVDMIVENHVIRHRYSGYGRPARIELPGGADGA